MVCCSLQCRWVRVLSETKPYTVGTEPQGSAFITLVLAFGPIFPHYPSSLPFGMGIYVLCHCLLEVRKWLPDLQGRPGTALSLRREFGTALRLLTTMGTFAIGLTTVCMI